MPCGMPLPTCSADNHNTCTQRRKETVKGTALASSSLSERLGFDTSKGLHFSRMCEESTERSFTLEHSGRGRRQSQTVADVEPGSKEHHFGGAPARERRVSRDILKALTHLELVSGRTSEAIETLARSRRASASVCDDNDLQLPEWKMREQLIEIKSRLRETKAELASVSYRAEMLESEGNNLRRQLAAACQKMGGDPGSWELVDCSPEGETSTEDCQLPLPLLLEEKQAVVDRLTEQLDFYARELEAKVEREQYFKLALAKKKDECAQLERRLRREERKNTALLSERKKLLAVHERVQALSERYQAEYQRVEEFVVSAGGLSRDMAVRDSVVNDLVIRCTLMEQKLRQLRLLAQRMSKKLTDDRDEEVFAYREEIAWLHRCLLEKLLPRSDGDASSGSASES